MSVNCDFILHGILLLVLLYTTFSRFTFCPLYDTIPASVFDDGGKVFSTHLSTYSLLYGGAIHQYVC